MDILQLNQSRSKQELLKPYNDLQRKSYKLPPSKLQLKDKHFLT